MRITLSELCGELRNWFKISSHRGIYTIENGAIDLSALVASGNIQINQYFRIQGSVFNDGVYRYPTSELNDETFRGIISPMSIPKDLLSILDEINIWQEKYGAADGTALSPYSSESFDGYSYSKVQGYASAGGGTVNSWKSAFSARLTQWRKL